MSSRERMLAIAAGAALLLIFGRGIWGRVAAPFEEKQTQISSLREDLQQLQLDARRGLKTRRRLKEFGGQSLPSNTALTKSNYQNWLNNLAKEVGVTEIRVRPPSGPAAPVMAQGRSFGESELAYYELKYGLSGKARLPELVELLHAIYSRGYLHKIEKCKATPEASDPRNLSFDLSISAIILPEAEESSKLPDRESDRLALADLAAYRDVIVERNLFGPPNNAPEVNVADRVEAPLGRPAEVEISATDPESHEVSYELLDGPEGAKIDGGKFTWPTTGEIGSEQVVRFAAIDDGVPQRRVEKEFKLAVVERRGPPIETFDTAKATGITGLVEVNNRPMVWVFEKPTGREFHLHEGDDLEIGEFKATITVIDLDDQFVRFRYDEREYLWPMNDTLAAVLEKPPETEATAAATEQVTASTRG